MNHNKDNIRNGNLLYDLNGCQIDLLPENSDVKSSTFDKIVAGYNSIDDLAEAHFSRSDYILYMKLRKRILPIPNQSQDKIKERYACAIQFNLILYSQILSDASKNGRYKEKRSFPWNLFG